MLFNTILQKHNIFFTTAKCNIGSNGSVASGNAGGKPCYLPFLSITVSSCQGEGQGNGRKGQKLISIFLFHLSLLFNNQELDHPLKDLVIFSSNTKIACTEFPSLIVC